MCDQAGGSQTDSVAHSGTTVRQYWRRFRDRQSARVPEAEAWPTNMPARRNVLVKPFNIDERHASVARES
jgi:hypothetical protein